MATAPTKSEIKEAQKLTQVAIDEKLKDQEAQGKTFVMDEHGAGVVPEDVWKAQKL